MQVMSETEGVLWTDGPVGPLEVRIESPRAAAIGVDIVICHPHPLHGGTLDNKVVHTLARAARDSGLRAVRFNFRGVGGSVGTHDDGRGEVDDLLAVVGGCTVAGHRLVLAGFSFGAWVAAAATARLQQQGGRLPAALLLVAPPVQYPGFARLPPLVPPTLVVQGDADEVVDAAAVDRWLRERQPGARPLTFATGHFFHGVLPELKAETARWLLETLSSPGAGG